MTASLRRRLDSPWTVLVLMAFAYALLISYRSRRFEGQLWYFILPGSKLCTPSELPPGIGFIPGAGYDGQYYYRLALNPFTSRAVEYGIRFDRPAYRSQRMLLPFLTWLVTWGHPRAA